MHIRRRKCTGVKKQRIQWLQEWDKNTKFFHASVAQRRKCNRIEQLEKEQGGVCETTEEIVREIYEFYEKLLHQKTQRGGRVS